MHGPFMGGHHAMQPPLPPPRDMGMGAVSMMIDHAINMPMEIRRDVLSMSKARVSGTMLHDLAGFYSFPVESLICCIPGHGMREDVITTPQCACCPMCMDWPLIVSCCSAM